MTMPFVSVLMPVRNEADFIEASLRAVLSQNYAHDRMEVLIADGQSTDGTRHSIESIAAGHPAIPVTIYDNPQQITPVGLNIIIRHAQGDILVRVDGHCIIAPDYVSRCVSYLLEGDFAGVGGPITTVADTPQGKVIAAAMSSPFGVGGAAFRTIHDKTMLVDTVAFPAYTRQVVELAGPYDEELVRNQDDEYNYRLRKLGGKILLASDIRATYTSRSTLRSLWRQYYQYGLYKVRVVQKHPLQMRLRQFVPFAFVFALIVGAMTAPFSLLLRYAWAALLLAYAAANLFASWRTASQARTQLFRLPLVFLVLHLSYGLGFWAGLFKFARRWGDTGVRKTA